MMSFNTGNSCLLALISAQYFVQVARFHENQ